MNYPGKPANSRPGPKPWFRLFSCALPDESQEDRQSSMHYEFRRIWEIGFGLASLDSV
jgi:hypothetical protein